MNYHKNMYKVLVLSHAKTDSSGEFVPEVITTEPIKGHWEDVTFEMISRSPQAIYNVGDRRLYTEVNLSPRDRIIIEELDGENSHWEVQARPQKLPYWAKLGVVRYSYHLVRLQANAGTPDPTTVLSAGFTDATAGEPVIDQSEPPEDIGKTEAETEEVPVWKPSWQ